MAFSDYEHCHYCVADKEAGRPLPERHGYKGLYVGDVEVPDHINVICSHHLAALQHEITTSRDREASHLAHIKALHQFLGDREEQEGIWIPRAEFKDIPKHDTAHYDVEGGEG